MRSSFSSSRLVRLLEDWTPVDAAPGGMDFAERLSLWLNAFDAIALQAANQSIRSVQSAAPGTRAANLDDDLQRTRAILAKVIGQDELPMPVYGEPEAAYAPWQRRHVELQRQMEQMVSALRDHVRQALGRVSARLRQLAALDASLEQVLVRREQSLLPHVASLLERRFEQQRLAHAQALEGSGGPDDPARWREPGGWMHAFGQEWRQALLSELELRLEPVAGLVDAWRNELNSLEA